MIPGEIQGLRVCGVSWSGEVVTGTTQKATCRPHSLPGNPHVDRTSKGVGLRGPSRFCGLCFHSLLLSGWVLVFPLVEDAEDRLSVLT